MLIFPFNCSIYVYNKNLPPSLTRLTGEKQTNKQVTYSFNELVCWFVPDDLLESEIVTVLLLLLVSLPQLFKLDFLQCMYRYLQLLLCSFEKVGGCHSSVHDFTSTVHFLIHLYSFCVDRRSVLHWIFSKCQPIALYACNDLCCFGSGMLQQVP